MIVIIDNGHGANTAGKCSPDGLLREFLWAREVAYALHVELQARGIESRIVTPEMQDVMLQTRVARINKECRARGANNCLLVSLHLNASGNGRAWQGARGFSAFVCKVASRRSKHFAELLTREAERRDLMGNRAMPKPDGDGFRWWTWSWTDKDIYILKNSSCPAVLTESGFMDNKSDAAMLASEDGKRRFVSLHADAIQKYVERYG